MTTDEVNTQFVRGIRFPLKFKRELIEEAMDMTPNPGDLIIATYPKCGTTWVGQILMLLLKKGVPPSTGEEAVGLSPYLEAMGVKAIAHQAPPRCYKVHFDYPSVPKQPEAKYFCVIRNPKDCLISFFHFAQTDLLGFKDDEFDLFFDLFVRGKLMYNDFFDHLLSWYERRHDSNVIFLYYEKMKKDIRASIKDIAEFMGPEYAEMIRDPKLLDDVVHYSGFDYMKKTTNELMASVFRKKFGAETDSAAKSDSPWVLKKVPVMVRKGIVGDWKTSLSSEQNQILDELIEKRIKGTEMYDYWKSIGCI